jgi:hypothetical protein
LSLLQVSINSEEVQILSQKDERRNGEADERGQS